MDVALLLFVGGLVGIAIGIVVIFVTDLIRIRRELESDIAVSDPTGFAPGDLVDIEGQRFEIR